MVWALVTPLPVKATSWDVLQSKLGMYYTSQPSKIVFRHTFYHGNQAESELINAYITALWKVTFHCEFQDLDDTLLDRLVCGERDIKLQWHLLANSDLTLKLTVKEAQATETAEQTMLKTHKPSSPSTLASQSSCTEKILVTVKH